MMILISVILFGGLVGAALIGRCVHRYLPQVHLSDSSRDSVKLAMGLVATMTALVLGLLVSSAKDAYDTRRSEVIQMAAKVAFLDLGQLRALLIAQSIPSISMPMLIILVSWLVVIFFGFSLIAPPNATTMLALVASAFSVACAIFLILELDQPFGGLIHIPSEPLINVLERPAK